jgi:glycosyltransferase involved in cell wall biosynthesis
MACGCPVVSFNNSGQTDIINHKENGYLASYGDVEDLAGGIEWVLENKDTANLSKACLKKVQKNYTESIVAGKYIDLYKKLLSKQNN